MNAHVSDLTKADLGTLVKTYRIPLHLHPSLLDLDLTMDHLPNDVVGVNKVVLFKIVCRDLGITPTVTLLWVFQSLCKQGDWFSFAKHRNTKNVCTDEGIPILADQNDMAQLYAHLIRLCEINEANHIIAPTVEGTPISLPTPDEIAAA
ncbi:hypothetical protein Tco_1087424 [Tanacetum coccineum]